MFMRFAFRQSGGCTTHTYTHGHGIYVQAAGVVRELVECRPRDLNLAGVRRIWFLCTMC